MSHANKSSSQQIVIQAARIMDDLQNAATLQRWRDVCLELVAMPPITFDIIWYFSPLPKQPLTLYLHVASEYLTSGELQSLLMYMERYLGMFVFEVGAQQHSIKGVLQNHAHKMQGSIQPHITPKALGANQPLQPQDLINFVERMHFLDQEMAVHLQVQTLSDDVKMNSVLVLDTLDSLTRLYNPEDKSGEAFLTPKNHSPKAITEWQKALVRFDVQITSPSPITSRVAAIVAQGLSPKNTSAWLSFTPTGTSVADLGAHALHKLVHASNIPLFLQFPAFHKQTPYMAINDLPRLPIFAGLPERGIELGEIDLGPNHQRVCVSADDLQRHVYVFGKTGTGKSTVLKRMIASAIEDQQQAVFVLDPHGDLVNDLLQWIPKEHVDRTVYIDFADEQFFPGINLFEATSDRDREYAISETDAFFLDLYGPEIWGPRIQDCYRNLALLLSLDPEGPGTLIDMLWGIELSNDHVRNRFLKIASQQNCPPTVKIFLEQISKKSSGSGSLAELISYFRAKFSPLVDNLYLRNILGQKRSTIHFQQFTAERKICFFNLNKGRLSSRNSNFIGRILMARLFQTALASSQLEQRDRPSAAIFIDEFQNFVSHNVEEILAEARKFRWSLVLANQYLAQLNNHKSVEVRPSSGMIESILGNVGTFICFRTSNLDAERVAPELGVEVAPSQLVALPNHRAICRLTQDGINRPPFLCKTHPLVPSPHDYSQCIRRRSQREWSVSRDIIEAEIRERLFGALGIAHVPKDTLSALKGLL